MNLSPVMHPAFSRCSLRNFTIGAVIKKNKHELCIQIQRIEVDESLGRTSSLSKTLDGAMRKTKEVRDENLLLRLFLIMSSHSSTVLPPFEADEKPPEAGLEPDSAAISSVSFARPCWRGAGFRTGF